MKRFAALILALVMVISFFPVRAEAILSSLHSYAYLGGEYNAWYFEEDVEPMFGENDAIVGFAPKSSAAPVPSDSVISYLSTDVGVTQERLELLIDVPGEVVPADVSAVLGALKQSGEVALTIFRATGGDITIGADSENQCLARLDIKCPINITVNGDVYGLFVYGGKVVVAGNVSKLTAADYNAPFDIEIDGNVEESSIIDAPGISVASSVLVNGDVERRVTLTCAEGNETISTNLEITGTLGNIWYYGTPTGDLTVGRDIYYGGIKGEGTLEPIEGLQFDVSYEKVSFYKYDDTFNQIIVDGNFSENLEITKLGEIEDLFIQYHFGYRNYSGENIWSVSATANTFREDGSVYSSHFLGSLEITPENFGRAFTVDDIPAWSSVSFDGVEEPIAIRKNLNSIGIYNCRDVSITGEANSLSVSCSNLEVQGNIGEMYVQNDVDGHDTVNEPELAERSSCIVVTGDVVVLRIRGPLVGSNLTVTGNVWYADRAVYTGLREGYSFQVEYLLFDTPISGSIVKDGVLQMPVYWTCTNRSNEGVSKVELPGYEDTMNYLGLEPGIDIIDGLSFDRVASSHIDKINLDANATLDSLIDESTKQNLLAKESFSEGYITIDGFSLRFDAFHLNLARGNASLSEAHEVDVPEGGFVPVKVFVSDQYLADKAYGVVCRYKNTNNDIVSEFIPATRNGNIVTFYAPRKGDYIIIRSIKDLDIVNSREARWGLAGLNDEVPETWTSGTLDEAMNYANGLESGTAYIQLLENMDTTAPLEFASGKTTILDLNGKTIDRGLKEATIDGYVVKVNGTLTLCDTSENATSAPGRITGGYSHYDGGGVFVDDGTFIMSGGNITENTVEGTYYCGGGGVSVKGTFTLNGGSISKNNTAGIDSSGGGVYVYSNSIFTMNGGTITGNTASRSGGGLYTSMCTFIMNGGSISRNTTSVNGGGGVYAAGTSFTMNDGYIVGNIAADSAGGGVRSSGSSFTMNGGSIAENTASSGGGVYVENVASSFTMNGGSISGNTALFGGGVDVSGLFTLNGGSIFGNAASYRGGGVFVLYCGTFIMSGGIISGNTATNDGGGVMVDGAFVGSGYNPVAWSEGVIQLSGKSVVFGNVKNGTLNETSGLYELGRGGSVNNVSLRSKGPIIVTRGLDDNASIGVTTASEPTNDAPITVAQGGGDSVYTLTASDAAKFTSDNGHKVVLEDNEIRFAENNTTGAVVIITQPTDVSVKLGETYNVSVEATGDGLKYQWYFKNATAKSFSRSETMKSATYSAEMTERMIGREIYCKITDAYGNTVTSDTVKITGEASTELKITQQPTNATAALGETISVSVEATGDGLKYQWYFKNANAAGFSRSETMKSATYSAEMTERMDGRQIYCVITDAYGNSVRTNTVTLTRVAKEPLAITKQPENTEVVLYDDFTLSVEAQGEGMKYEWYYLNAGGNSFVRSFVKAPTYTANATKSALGREYRCVITDALGNKIVTDTVTLTRVAKEPLAIVEQPVNAIAALGETASVSVVAEGEGLKYQWYFKNATAKSFSRSETMKSATYSVEMAKVRAGRELYCVITDALGNTVTTDVVKLVLVK